MNIAAIAVALVMASVLLWAGLEKVRNLASVASVMTQLGIPARRARMGAALLPALEVVVALGLIFQPASFATLAGVLCLSGAFAIAGFIALFRREEPIACGCFGPFGDGRLGFSQVASFPLWLGGAALLWLAAPGEPSYSRAASLLAAVALAMAMLRAFGALKEARTARADRRSAQEMLLWLKR